QIRSIGFAPLFAGVWVSPRVSADEAWEVLTMRKAMLATVLRTPNPRFGRPMTEAWSSTVIDEMYTGFIDSFSPFADIGDREVAPADALVLRTSLMNAWRLFKEQDPDLPQAMGLGSSLRVEARQLFVSLYDRLAPGAEQRVRQAVAAAELEAGTNHSSLVASYTVEARLEELERLRRAGSRLS
ncbi:MAG: PaaX family transcriptional regulator, partial [Microbacteriaceae bacterium]|nr:PaaX family transcriptional regulator [Microbacteriaceae bacterium]